MYQSSSSAIYKFHTVMHLADDIRNVRGLEYLQGSYYEMCEKHFKIYCHQTSKRVSSAMKETFLKRKTYSGQKNGEIV